MLSDASFNNISSKECLNELDQDLDGYVDKITDQFDLFGRLEIHVCWVIDEVRLSDASRVHIVQGGSADGFAAKPVGPPVQVAYVPLVIVYCLESKQ